MKTNRLLLFLSIVMIGFLTSCEKKCNCDDQNFTPPDGTYTYSDEGRTKEMLNYSEVVEVLTEYDKTRKVYLEKALGYEDTRINNVDFEQFKKYLGHIEKLSDSAKIKITGISFVSAVNSNYEGSGKGYQELIYVPTTTINKKQVAFDPVQSLKEGRLVTVKEMLRKYKYNWPFGKNDIQEIKSKSAQKPFTEPDKESGFGNHLTLSPPF